jgi:hypothetical protein
MYSKKENFLKTIEKVQQSDGCYRPTKYAVTRWFNILNDVLFSNSLDKFKTITIKQMKRAWGECRGNDDQSCDLILHNRFNTKSEFIEVLGHEMVHHYQWLFEEDMDHGDTFFAWKKLFNKNNLELSK